MKTNQKIPSETKAEDRFNEQEPPKPAMVLAMIWLVVVTILSIGLGVLSLYTAVTDWRDMQEVSRILQDRQDTNQYYYDEGLDAVCTLQFPSNPDYCFSTTGDITKYTISFLVAKSFQLVVLFIGNFAMWRSDQKNKYALAIALSFLTIIAWILCSLLTPLIFSILS